MKTPAFWLVMVVIPGCMKMAMAQKQFPASDAARQWLDSLTAQETSSAGSSGVNGNYREIPLTDSTQQTEVGVSQTTTSAAPKKWSNLKKQASRFSMTLSRLAQATGYVPPVANYWKAAGRNDYANAGPSPYTNAGYTNTNMSSYAPAPSVAYRHITGGIVSLDVPVGWQVETRKHMAQLIIVARNSQPHRESHVLRTWFLDTQHGRTAKLAITRVGSQPQIREKKPAA